MTDTSANEQPPQEEEVGNRRLLDRLIFEQDLNEVHLLIDFISGRSDRSLSTLAMPDPLNPTHMLSSGEIVQRITRMRYPPDKNPVFNSQNAAILLLAKDRLTALAAPARGLTIAYTAMFIDAEARTMWLHFRDWLRGRRERKQRRDTPSSPRPAGHEADHAASAGGRHKKTARDHDTRVDLAATTFPALRPHAGQFRRWRRRLGWLAVIWLLMTALTYWDVGLGRAVLDRLDQNWKARTALLQDYPEFMGAEHCEAAALAPNSGEAHVANPVAGPAPGGTATTNETNRKLAACQRYLDLARSRRATEAEVQRVFGCEEISPIFAHVWCWRWILSGSVAQLDEEVATVPQAAALEKALRADGVAAANKEENPGYVKIEWQTAAAILSIYTTYILPMMFALLGTLIGSFRSILNKIRDSELAPRDLVRMILGIPTGLVAGVAVGLFLSPSSVPVEGSGGLGGQLTLTASALGFLAGYASQSFFTYLENVIGTVFPNTSPPKQPCAVSHTVHLPAAAPASPPAVPSAGQAGGTAAAGETRAPGGTG
jgi:hypothetical protein